MADNYMQATVSPSQLPIPSNVYNFLAEMVEIDFETTVDDAEEEHGLKYPEEFLVDGRYLDEDIKHAYYSFNFDISGKDDNDEALYYINFPRGFSAECVVILQFILRHLPESIKDLRVEGAHTCSKLRPGEWGGFAGVITRTDHEYVDTNTWLAETSARLVEADAEPAPSRNPELKLETRVHRTVFEMRKEVMVRGVTVGTITGRWSQKTKDEAWAWFIATGMFLEPYVLDLSTPGSSTYGSERLCLDEMMKALEPILSKIP